MTEKMTLDKWYGTAIRIPKTGGWALSNFVGSCMGIVRSVYRKHTGTPVRIRFLSSRTMPTAAADRENNTIYMNQDYLRGDLRINMSPFTIEESIVFMLGLITHEAGHFKSSPQDLTTWSDYIEMHCAGPYVEKIAQMLGNITEDIYVEADINRCLPSLSWMLDGMNEIVFSDMAQDKVEFEASSIEAPPTNMIDLSYACNALIFAKTQWRLELPEYLQVAFDMAKGAAQLEVFEDRKELTLELYDYLMQEMPESECKGGGDEVLDIAVEHSAGATPSHYKGGPESSSITRASYSDAGRVESVLDIIGEDSDITMISDSRMDVSENEETALYIEKPMSLGSASVVADMRYQKLAEAARQVATVNRPYGQDRTSGHNMRKLYRIGTDQKIFAEPMPMRDHRPMQVMIVVDCSGSMDHPVYRRGEPYSEATKVDNALSAALGAAWGLAEARCDVSVYGHTGDVASESEVFIYRAKGFGERLEGLPLRLGQMGDNEPHKQNRDGYALRYLAKKFTSQTKRRVMIVISDGAPLANNYSGEDANEHSRQSVEYIRRQRIEVLSISIDQQAYATNNYIYGEKYNTTNTDPHVIRDIIAGLIL